MGINLKFNETHRCLKDGNDVIVESPQHDILENEDQLEEKVSNNAILPGFKPTLLNRPFRGQSF